MRYVYSTSVVVSNVGRTIYITVPFFDNLALNWYKFRIIYHIHNVHNFVALYMLYIHYHVSTGVGVLSLVI